MEGGSRLVEALSNAVQLSSDRDRHGQDAFIASPFSRLALTHVLSVAGDALVTLALAGSLFFNISLTSARSRVALSLVLTMAPFAVVAPFLGPIIDRSRRGRKAMVLASAAGRAVACLLMARSIHSLWLFPAAFLTLVFSKGYTVAKAALVPSAVERPEDLVEANSKLAVSGAIVGFLAAIPGVAILKLLNAAWVLRIDALLFVGCAFAALRLQVANPDVARASPTAAPAPGRAARPAPWETDATLVDGAPAGRWEPRPEGAALPAGIIQVAAVTMGMLRLMVGFMTFLVAFGFRRQHAPAWWYGVVLASSIGGNLIGAAIAPWLRSRLREEWILLSTVLGVAGAGVLTFAFNAFRGRPAASLLAGVIGLAAGAAKLAFDSLVQHRVPAVAQGRAFGRFEAGFQLVWVLGSLLPVVIPMTLWAGFAVVTVLSSVTAGAYLIGIQLARLGRLPPWWPGASADRPHAPRRRPPVALTRGVGVPPSPAAPDDPTREQAPGDDGRPGPILELDRRFGAAPTTELRWDTGREPPDPRP